MSSDINRDVKIKFMGDVSDVNKKIDSVGEKGKQMGNKLDAAGTKGKTGLDKVGTSAQSAKVDLAAVAVAVQGMTSSIAGMAQQVLDFESKIIALNKTVIGLESQELALKRMQEDLTDAVNEGTVSARDYQRAIEDMELAFKNARLEEQNIAAETNKLNGEFVSFGVNAVGTIAQVTIAMTAMGISASGALAGMVTGIRLVGSTLWTIAKHPVFLIITAGILAWELGLKSIVENLTGIDDLGIFSNLEKAFAGITEGENTLETLNEDAMVMSNTFRDAVPFVENTSEAMAELSTNTDKADKSINRLTKSQEVLMRQSGFSAGAGGGTLSQRINREADNIEIASQRTLAAASLHEALKVAGLTGGGRNTSGFITPTLASMVAAGRTRSGNFSSSGRIRGVSIAGSGQRFTGINGLTRSNVNRRRGRNRNGGFRARLNGFIREQEGRFADTLAFTGRDFFQNRGRGRRGNNSSLSSTERIEQDIASGLAENQRNLQEAFRRRNRFDNAFGGKGNRHFAQIALSSFGLDKFDVFEGDVDQSTLSTIKNRIDATKFFTDAERFGNSGETKISILTSGYREFDDQIAFQGKERFQTVGT